MLGNAIVVPTEVATSGQPTAGTFELDGDDLYFTPRFPFVDGTSYSLVAESDCWSIRRPPVDGRSTTDVVAIYPTAPALPVNALRLYVFFSAPMSEDFARDAVSVRRADGGKALDGALLLMEPELWDARRTRLTLLFDPGRIKRGLDLHEEAGYPLLEGVAVEVEVDASFRDAEGRPLRDRATRRYDVVAPARERVDPGRWQLETPSAGSTEPLTVAFDRPLDRALVERCLVVEQVAGTVAVADGELEWRFFPYDPWQAGAHTLRVDARLEDLAGNSVQRVFDRDLSQAADDPLAQRSVTLGFSCH